MATYRYSAISQAGKRMRGWMVADNMVELGNRLQAQGLDLLMVTESIGKSAPRGRITVRQLISFFSQLADYLHAGVPVLQALDEMAMPGEHAALVLAIQTLRADIQSGNQLSVAMQAQPAVFPAMVCQLVAAGELSGQLVEILQHLAQTLEWQARLQSEVKRGLVYPAFLAVMVSLAAVVMLTFLVPQMASFLSSLGQTLPWSTRCLLALSGGMVAYGGYGLAGMVAISLTLAWRIRRDVLARTQWHRLLLAMPVVGRVLHQWMLARFCRFLGLMYQAGIPLLQALAICKPMFDNRVMVQALEQVLDQITAGQSLSQSFRQSAYFPPMMIRLLATGESTGTLDKVLLQLATSYDHAAKTTLQTMLGLLEPLLTMVMGGMLLLLMVAVMLPVYDSFSSVHY